MNNTLLSHVRVMSRGMEMAMDKQVKYLKSEITLLQETGAAMELINSPYRQCIYPTQYKMPVHSS